MQERKVFLQSLPCQREGDRRAQPGGGGIPLPVGQGFYPCLSVSKRSVPGVTPGEGGKDKPLPYIDASPGRRQGAGRLSRSPR